MKRTSFCFLAMLAAVGATASAHAQEKLETAPPLYGVEEMRLQYPRIVNPEITTNCGLTNQDLMAIFKKELYDLGLPVFSVVDAPPFKSDVARIDLWPDIVTVQPREKECISWVALTAQSREILKLPPVETPRAVWVTYFSGGLMIGGGRNAHPNAVKEAMNKLGTQLRQQYGNDQPPSLAPATELMPTKN
ncbi:MAG: hypothetical protein FWF24_04030 [Alphaproteobacteria bacterium]|nr:hypothetical protein [Alphaproteobacteria bacterium]